MPDRSINAFHGNLVSHVAADPAAGAECQITVPTRRRWKIIGIRLSLVTDATVINRSITLFISDGTYSIHAQVVVATQAASLTYHYYFSPTGNPELQSGTRIISPIPPLILAADSTLDTITTNIQAGDNFGAPVAFVEEWIDP